MLIDIAISDDAIKSVDDTAQTAKRLSNGRTACQIGLPTFSK
jgi:hypothetical protein